MSEVTPTDLLASYEAAYTFPFSKYSWRSARGRACWHNLEGWQDALAGPVSSIARNGGCSYVYTRDDQHFAGVNDPSALYSRLKDWHGRLIAALDDFVPASETEEIGLASMREFASAMWAVTEEAVEVERARLADAKA